MSEVAELERQDIANMEQEDFEKLKKQVEETEEGEDIVIGEEDDDTPDDPTPPEEDGEDNKEEDTPDPKPEDKKENNDDDLKNKPDQIIDEYLSSVREQQDLSKYSPEELQKIIHVQNKRLGDKDGFINTLQQEKRQERSKLREEINKLQKEYEEKKKNRLSKDELNEQYREDPIGTQETIEQYKQEDKEAEVALLENQKQEKRLYNMDLMINVDQQSDVKFEDLIPEMKQVLKNTKIFSDQQIEAFAKDPYLEDFDVLLEIKNKARALKQTSITKEDNPNQQPQPQNKEDELKNKAEVKRKEDLADKINRVNTRKTNPLRGTGGKTPDADLVGNLKQTNNGRYDLTSLSREELAKLKKQALSLD